MTSCTRPAAVGELGDVCQRLRALEPWWREEQTEAIREALAQATGLVERQAEAREAKRAAEDELRTLAPNGTRATQQRWRELQAEVTRQDTALLSLHASEVSLRSFFGVEQWWARTAYWKAGVSALNAQERDAG